jgi:hypothetical protein
MTRAPVRLFDRVALAADVPAAGVRRGDVAVVVDRVEGDGVEDAYVLEVFNALGETLKIIDVPVSAVVPLSTDEVLAVRPLTETAASVGLR